MPNTSGVITYRPKAANRLGAIILPNGPLNRSSSLSALILIISPERNHAVMLQPANYDSCSNSLFLSKFLYFFNRKEALTIKLANCRLRRPGWAPLRVAPTPSPSNR